jgi:hypothetical protein
MNKFGNVQMGKSKGIYAFTLEAFWMFFWTFGAYAIFKSLDRALRNLSSFKLRKMRDYLRRIFLKTDRLFNSLIKEVSFAFDKLLGEVIRMINFPR